MHHAALVGSNFFRPLQASNPLSFFFTSNPLLFLIITVHVAVLRSALSLLGVRYCQPNSALPGRVLANPPNARCVPGLLERGLLRRGEEAQYLPRGPAVARGAVVGRIERVDVRVTRGDAQSWRCSSCCARGRAPPWPPRRARLRRTCAGRNRRRRTRGSAGRSMPA